MSFNLKLQDKVHNSHLNNSKSKQLYSFSKNPRFHNTIHLNCYQAYYDLPDLKSKRKAGIGYGEKIGYMKINTSTPGPAYYLNKSIFDTRKKSVYCIANSNSVKNNKHIILLLQILEKSQQRKSIKVRPSTSNSKNVQEKGSQLLMTPDNNNKTLSKFSLKNIYYDPPSADRFQSSSSNFYNKYILLGKNVPGPATYYQKSDFELNKGTKFGNTKRKDYVLPSSYTPGPGAYQIYSEFGFGV